MQLLIKSNIKKSKRTSVAFFLLFTVTMLLSYTGSQMTEGFRRLYLEKIEETNSADFAAAFSYSFYEAYEEEISAWGQPEEKTGILEMEITEALLLRGTDIKAGNSGTVNGSWIFRNADRKENLSSFQTVERLEQIPENCIYVPYVCKTFFGFRLGDVLCISSEGWQESFVIAGFTEDVLFGSRANLAFDLPEKEFRALWEKTGADCHAVMALMRTDGNVSRAVSGFSGFAASKADEAGFYLTSDIEYAQAARKNNINLYATILKAAFLISIAACFMVIAFHMRNTLERDAKELGILKAAGYRGGEIVRTYVLQFLLLGVLGSTAGVCISQSITPLVIRNIATDIGFAWENTFLWKTAAESSLQILLTAGAVTLFLARGIFRLRPVDALQERSRLVFTGNSRKYTQNTIEKMIFPVNLSIVCKMISAERVKSILTCAVVSVIMCVAGFAVILYARLVKDKDGLLQVTGAEVYSVNVQAARPEETEEIARELEGAGVRKVMTAIEPGSSRLLCEGEVYAALGVYGDYGALENPALYEGRYPRHENEAAISGNLAQAFGKGIGDTIKAAHIFQETAEEEDFLIVGLTQGTYTGGMDIYLTMDGLRKIDPSAEWQSVHVYLEEENGAEEYCHRLEKEFSGRLSYAGVFKQVFDSQFAPIISSVSGIVFFIMAVMALLIVIMGYFVTNSILLTRKTDFGIMKALGYSDGQMMFQAVVTFLLYIAGGSLAGSLFLYFGSNAVIAGMFRGMGVYRVAFPFPAAWIAALVLCMEAAGCLTAFVSAWKIRNVVPCGLMKAGS